MRDDVPALFKEFEVCSFLWYEFELLRICSYKALQTIQELKVPTKSCDTLARVAL